MIRAPLVAASLAALIATPAPASDFSRLSEPGFARTMLLAPARQHEVQCVAAAVARAKGTNASSADAIAMAQALAERLAVELGSAADARDLLDHRVAGFQPNGFDSPDYAAEKEKELAMVLDQCGELLGSYRSGGLAAFKAALAPATGLVPLLPLDQCLAIIDASSRLEHAMFSKEDGQQVRRLVSTGLSAAELASLDRAVAAAAETVRPGRIDDRSLEMKSVACLATIRTEVDKRGPQPSSDTGSGG